MKEVYTKEKIQCDYDLGYTLEVIAERYRVSQAVDFENKISSKKAYSKICEIIYEYIMKRGFI